MAMITKATLIADLRAKRLQTAELLATERYDDLRAAIGETLTTIDDCIALIDRAEPFLIPE